MLTTEEKAVLARIQASIPKEWTDNVTKKQVLAPKFAKLIRDLASGNKNPDINEALITDKEREKAKAIVDSGEIAEFEKEVDVEDKEVTKQIEDFIDKEIEKAMVRGELPKGKKFRNLHKKIQWKKSKNK